MNHTRITSNLKSDLGNLFIKVSNLSVSYPSVRGAVTFYVYLHVPILASLPLHAFG
ncbi:MAG: hypothetical protein WCV90_01270 [Candidatus Woesearchaeota archaeon]